MSAESVRAILDRRKTQTRRVVNPQPAHSCHYEMNGSGTHLLHLGPNMECVPATGTSADHRLRCPYGVPGDLLWVQETWGYEEECVGYLEDNDVAPSSGWIRASRMKRRDSRLWLLVVKVRVERVQEISGHDALCEGVLGIDEPTVAECDGRWPSACAGDAKRAYAVIWDSLNAKPKPVYRTVDNKRLIDHYVSYPWALEGGITEREYRNRRWLIYPNPYVWVIRFEQAEKPA